MSAGHLGIGTELVTRAGPQSGSSSGSAQALVVKSVTPVKAAIGKDGKRSGFVVYNLEVEDDHTYFVGDADGGAWVHNQCGMLGKASTRGLDNAIATDLEKGGWKVTHGAGRGPQEAILDPAWQPTGRPGRPAGTVFPDITATKDGVTMRIQTVDTLKNGNMTGRESDNLNRILQRRPGDPVYWFPKNGGW